MSSSFTSNNSQHGETTNLTVTARRNRGRPPTLRPCQYCHLVQEGYQALRNHYRSCPHNPSNIVQHQEQEENEDVEMADVSHQDSQHETDGLHDDAHQQDINAMPDYTDEGEPQAGNPSGSEANDNSNRAMSVDTLPPTNEDGKFQVATFFFSLTHTEVVFFLGIEAFSDEADDEVDATPDFHDFPDNLLDVKYKTVGIVGDDTDDLACVYDCSNLQEIGGNTYTTSELISIELYDLVHDFAIPREAYRRLVRLMNTMIRDKEKLGRGNRKKSPSVKVCSILISYHKQRQIQKSSTDPKSKI
jgi:hypothetical protein